MAKITLDNGMIIEGTVEELTEMAKAFGEQDLDVNEPVAEGAPKFNVGDYAKLKTTNDPLFGFYEGQIVKLYENNSGSDFKVRSVDGRTGYTDAINLKSVSAEEVAEAKLAEQFAKLGRKPNELKDGDIVRVDEPDSEVAYGVIKDGPTGSLSGGNYSVIGYGIALGDYIELIAPVESRVDGKVGVSQ